MIELDPSSLLPYLDNSPNEQTCRTKNRNRTRRRRQHCYSPIGGRWILYSIIILLSLLVGRSNGLMTSKRKLELRDLVKKTWYHGYDNYMKHAFPDDELRPLSCTGIGQDHENPNNHETNDVLGDFSMTLIDTLDTFVALRDVENFRLAVWRIVEQIPSFDLNSKVQLIVFYPLSILLLEYLMLDWRGSLLLEFATLSRLLGDPIYENAARKAFYALWDRRSMINLFGNTIDIQTAYKAVMTYMRSPDGFWYRGVNMQTGAVATTTIDSLAAFWPGLQVLAGDIEAAIQSHLTYANLWARYSGIPEVFDIHRKQATSLGYPLRPEFIESNYFLYLATKDEYYLEVAERVIHDLVNRTWVDCGLASIANLITGKHEDRQHSFMLSETLKYLYLTFDEENPINHVDEPFIFTTEGHILYIPDAQDMPQNQGYRTGWEERESLFSITSEFQTFNPLKLSITDRTDFDYARMITGSMDSVINSNHSFHHLDDNLWSNFGFCEVPAVDDHVIELIFSYSADDIERNPGPDKVEFYGTSSIVSPSTTTAAGPEEMKDPVRLDMQHPSTESSSLVTTHVLVKNLTGLTFSLKKRFDQDSYEIVGVGSYSLSAKTQVILTDPYAIKVLKPQTESEKISQRDRDHLTGIRVYYEDLTSTNSQEPTEDGLDLKASDDGYIWPGFGNEPLEVVGLNPPNEYGCMPIMGNTPESLLQKKERVEDVHGKVILIKRGECTFADKVQNAVLAGAHGIIVANQDDNLLIPTSDRIKSRDEKENESILFQKQHSSSPSPTGDALKIEDDDHQLNEKLKSIPLLFSTLETGRSMGQLLANRRLSSSDPLKNRKLMIEIVNPLDLLDRTNPNPVTNPSILLLGSSSMAINFPI
ncbi:hypothetical protein KEM48_012310 [Puccinia striiformis f. sp. tritici PST-130]|nr:hypothetical protein KEM48_012310 [Puccinia striiformis f. sp. tritici PST-130]